MRLLLTPDIKLTDGTIIAHSYMENGAQNAFCKDDPSRAMTESQWTDYCTRLKEFCNPTVPMFTLNNGTIVLGKSSDSPQTYSNRTQALKRIEKLGPGWTLYQAPISRVFYVAHRKSNLRRQFSKTAEQFQATIKRIADAAQMSALDVYSLWREYSDACISGDQSPVMFEFIQWKQKELGRNEAMLRQALESDYTE